jgi:excisionase family DNA binding protein
VRVQIPRYGLKVHFELVDRGRFLLERNRESETLLTPSEVANLFRVDPKTVTRWAKSGKLTAIRTLGGHRRYRKSEVEKLLSERVESRSV